MVGGGDAPPADARTYDPRWFDLLDKVEDRHFRFAARRRVVGALARRAWTGAAAGAWVLEIGCGNGGLLSTLQDACPGANVIGVDLFSDALKHARRRSSAHLLQADVTRPPFGAQFHLIGMFDVLEHLPDDIGVLRDVRKLLMPGGALLLTVPAHAWLWSDFDVHSDHRRRYSPRGLRTALEISGFRVEYLSQFMAALLPIMWLSRRARPSNPTAELRIVPGVNGMMRALLSFEAALIGRQFRLGMGTSVIALARPEPTA